MTNSFLKKTSWMALAVALLIGGSVASVAATKTSDTSSETDTKTTENKNADEKTKTEIKDKINKRLETDMKADAKTLQTCPNCQAKYILTMPGIGQIGTLSYEKRDDLREGGDQCKEEVYKALKKEGQKTHPCVAEELRYDPANMAVGIFNVDADIDVEHDNEYAVLDLTRTCAMMGKDGKSGDSAGQKCCEAWEKIADEEHKRPIRYWKGNEEATKEIMKKFCCNLTKREKVEDGETPESLNEEAFCQTESQEKVECVNGKMETHGLSTKEAWEQCDVECSNGKQFADLFHDSEGVDSSKTESERKKEVDEAIQECYKDESWSPSATCLTASELAPVMPTSAATIVNKELSDSDKGTGKKLKSVNSQVLKTMTVTASGKANANSGSKDTTGSSGKTGTNDEKAYENNINSVRENQNKIKVNAASRAVALGKRAVWLATTAGEDVDNMAKKLEKSDDFMTMFKGMAELQAQHLQKTTQNTALRAKLSELSSIDGIISGSVITTHESDIENDETSTEE